MTPETPTETRHDFSAQQRAAIVVQMLTTGPQTARDLAEATGLSLRSIYYVLDNISLSLPITNSGGIWYMLSSDEHREIHYIMREFEDELANARQCKACFHTVKVSDLARLVAIMRRFITVPEPN
jgi:transcriptional antiterminator